MTTLLVAGGCHHAYLVPETPLPPNTILLSQVMRQVASEPGYPDTLLVLLGDRKPGEANERTGAAMMTPRLLDSLRARLVGKDWQGLDRFPGWTMRELTPVADLAERIASADAGSTLAARMYLDLGPYVLDKRESVSLDRPSTLPGFDLTSVVSKIVPAMAGGDRLSRGDFPNALASEHSESQRLADVLNRLAASAAGDGAQPLTVTVHGASAHTPEALMRALQSAGEDVTVDDARYFANFGHLHFRQLNQDTPEDVMMPFWVNTEIPVPHSGGRFLLLPVSHAEYEFHVHGPVLNADVSYYFGVDGKSEWRTMDTLDQAWVLGRNAHEYRGEQALEVTRLAGLLTVAYLHQHELRPKLPFGGYYTLGVCQDGVSAIEKRMTRAVTLYPNTVDAALFTDPRDAEVNTLLAAIPSDRNGGRPDVARVLGSLPLAPGQVARESRLFPLDPFDGITIPGLSADLNAVYHASQNGEMDEANEGLKNPRLSVGLLAALSIAILIVAVSRRFRRSV